MSKPSHLAWNTTKMVNKYLEGLNINNCNPEKIINIYTQPPSLNEED